MGPGLNKLELMQNQHFEASAGPHAHFSRFPSGGSAAEMRPDSDDFRPQLHLVLHGPDGLAVGSVLRFEAEAEALGAPVRLLAHQGRAAGAAVYTLPLSQLTAPTTVALSVAGLAPGRYALWADALSNFSATAVWLVDAHAEVRVNLRQNPVYVFTAVASATGRFWLHLLPLPARPSGPAGMRGLAAQGVAQA